MAACGGDSAPRESGSGYGGITATGGGGDDGTGSGGSDGGSGGGGDGAVDGGSSDSGGGGPVFDVGANGDVFCQDKAAGVYCNDNKSVTCGNMGDVVDTTSCVPGACLAGTGCVDCLDGQMTCVGPYVMSCNAAANPPTWQMAETCDPGSNQSCNLALGTCAQSAPIGDTTPTGVYYQFGEFFSNDSDFKSGYDVDGLDDRVYVSTDASTVSVYSVELLDSDGDGKFEPNQHPDNPDNTGPIEERTLTFVQDYAFPGQLDGSHAELYVNSDGVYAGGNSLGEMAYATMGVLTPIAALPGWMGGAHQIGYDDVSDVWYASNESNRRVMMYDKPTSAWGIAFDYPSLAGDHMDGLEVVTQPETGIAYVYVSDMTSDFIGQYHLDPDVGWIQENLFSYNGTAGSLVEGMGFGPLNHFWATSGDSIYEIGGGDLADFLEPPG